MLQIIDNDIEDTNEDNTQIEGSISTTVEEENETKEIDPNTSLGAKFDQGKLRISLVPMQIVRDVAKVRMFANIKYKSPSNWVYVEKQRYIDALMRHVLEYCDNPNSIDKESGLPTLAHIACNVAFLCEMSRDDWEERKEIIISNDPTNPNGKVEDK